jgi:RluA family pseudouridine synthase
MKQQREVDAPNAGRRLDAYVRHLCPEVPLGTLMKWMRKGQLRVNGKRAKPSTRLAKGDAVALPFAPDAAPRPPKVGPRLPLPEILYEDADLLVVLKPAALACHGGTGHGSDSLIARVVQYLGAQDAPPGHRPGLAQRLDGGVSGLLPIGKHAAALRRLARQVESGDLDKVYTALVHGRVRRPQGCIDVPLRVDDEPMGDRPRAHPDPARGKPAETLYTVLERGQDATLVEVRLRTGRTHQIRAHMRHLGHPLLGDPRYGIAARNAYLRETFGLDHPFLHAGALRLLHPATGEPLHLVAALPPALERIRGSLLDAADASVKVRAGGLVLAHRSPTGGRRC